MRVSERNSFTRTSQHHRHSDGSYDNLLASRSMGKNTHHSNYYGSAHNLIQNVQTFPPIAHIGPQIGISGHTESNRKNYFTTEVSTLNPNASDMQTKNNSNDSQIKLDITSQNISGVSPTSTRQPDQSSQGSGSPKNQNFTVNLTNNQASTPNHGYISKEMRRSFSKSHANAPLSTHSTHSSTSIPKASSSMTLDSFDSSPLIQRQCIYNPLFHLLANESLLSLSLSGVLPQNSIPTVSQTLLDVSLKAKTSPALALSLIHQEIYTHQHAPQSIFRSNSLAAKFLGGYVYRVGKGWLKLVIGGLLAELLDADVSLEIDEDKLRRSHKDLSKEEIAKMAQENAKNLEYWTSVFLHRIMDKEVMERMPSEVYLACKYISQISDSLNLDTPVVIGAFIMLRFINPGIATPEIFNLIDLKKKTSQGQRNLILVSKVIQNLANGVAFSGTKEPYMVVMNDFVMARMSYMRHYFTSLIIQNGMENFTYDMEAFCPFEAIRIESTELKGLIHLHRLLFTHGEIVLQRMFIQGMNLAMSATQITQTCLEFILALEQAGVPLTDEEEAQVMLFQTKSEMNLQKGLKQEVTAPTVDILEGKKSPELYNFVNRLIEKFVSLVQEKFNYLDNSLFDDKFLFYRCSSLPEAESTYCLIVRRITSNLFSEFSGFVFHLIKTLGDDFGKPIRLILDFTYCEIFDEFSSLVVEAIDALTFLLPSRLWNVLQGDIIVLNFPSEGNSEAYISNLISYINEANDITLQPRIQFLDSEFLLSQYKALASNLPLISLRPPKLLVSVLADTILGVKARHLILGPNSLLEIDPETQCISSEHRMLAIDELGNMDDPYQIRLLFHAVVQSDSVFKDLEPISAERVYRFSTVEEKEEFAADFFETVVECTQNPDFISMDFDIDDETLLKVMNICILIIHRKQRRILEILPLTYLQYARVHQSKLQIQLRNEELAREIMLTDKHLFKKDESERSLAEQLLYTLQQSLKYILHQQQLFSREYFADE